MIPAPLNLYFKQGASFTLSVRLLQGEVIRTTADVQAGATEIPVEPMTEAIAAGRKVLFGDFLILTISAEVAVGATSLPINATPLPIIKKTKGWVCADLTGCTARSQFKGKLTKDATPKQFTAEFDSDRLSGLFYLKLTATQTTLVPPNLELGTVVSDDELQSRKRQPHDYDWDVELVYPDSRVECPHQGVIVVYPETTTVVV